eukprot:9455159-Alexandrium_andersonii.AAC.1
MLAPLARVPVVLGPTIVPAVLLPVSVIGPCFLGLDRGRALHSHGRHHSPQLTDPLELASLNSYRQKRSNSHETLESYGRRRVRNGSGWLGTKVVLGCRGRVLSTV